MIAWLLSFVGRCAHKHYTFPQTDKAGPPPSAAWDAEKGLLIPGRRCGS
jgi:hypothetical protein